MTSAAKFGATADAMENIVKTAKETIMMIFRPYCSDKGPHASGPKAYPTRYMDVGSINMYSLYSLKWSDMGSIAPDARLKENQFEARRVVSR
jgi:hypothetical protein